jgi:hypothetical protein
MATNSNDDTQAIGPGPSQSTTTTTAPPPTGTNAEYILVEPKIVPATFPAAAEPPPTGTNAEHILVGLQIVPATFPAAAEPPPGNTNAGPDDPDSDQNDNVDAPPPLGFRLTGYKLLNIVVLFTIGVAKFILSLQGHSISPTGLEWAGGCLLATL